MFNRKLKERIARLEREQERHCKDIADYHRELTELREDRDMILDQLNLALIKKPAKYPERKIVSRASTEYAESRSLGQAPPQGSPLPSLYEAIVRQQVSTPDIYGALGGGYYS